MDPHAGRAALGVAGDAPCGEGIDHGSFEQAHIAGEVQAKVAEFEDGVDNELARAVIRDITASVGLGGGDAEFGELRFAGQQIGLCSAGQSDGRGMLDEENCGLASAINQGLIELTLQGQGWFIGE